MTLSHTQLAQRLAELFARLPQVEAVALGGSRGGSAAFDSTSDIDVYVYTRAEIPVASRAEIVTLAGGASRADLGMTYWGPSDEWFHAPSGIDVDLVYFDAGWMTEQIARVVEDHQPSQGYSTCFWYTVRHSVILSDPRGWFAALQQRCAAAYPTELRRAILALNVPLLRGIIPSYAHQIEKAVQRGDLVSVNHRLAALLASYFDVLFAFNHQLHPGEKRLVSFALSHCANLPVDFESDLSAVLRLTPQEAAELPARLDRLLTHLEDLLAAQP